MPLPEMELLSLLILLSILHLTLAQAPVVGGVDNVNLSPSPPVATPFSCKRFYRELDGTCSNNRDPEARYWGSSRRAQNSYIQTRNTSIVPRRNLPSPREISMTLSEQINDVYDERKLSEMAAFFGQFLAYTLAATPLSDESFDIPIKPGDSHARDHAALFGNDSALPFRRSVRTKAERRDFVERPMNSVSSAVDLSNVYGSSKLRNDFLRNLKSGTMKETPKGVFGLLPKNLGNFRNAPSTSPEFFLAGDHRANQHPVLTALHTVFLREHNRLVREVVNKTFGTRKSASEIFEIARRINEAQFQRIVYEEWLPAIIGRHAPKYKGFQKESDITASTELTTAALRFGYSMVGNTVKLKGARGAEPDSRPLKGMFFNVVEDIEKFGIEDFLRGALSSRAQKVDLFVVDTLREGLFSGVKDESMVFDLVASTIQRGRDHGIANYNSIRSRFGRPKALSFADISSDPNVQRRLRTAYLSASRVELWPGLLAEDHPHGSSVGPTLGAFLRAEFNRLRNGDRLFYRNEHGWQREVRRLKIVRRLLESKRDDFDVFREVLLNNTNIRKEDLPRRIFFVN